SSFKSRSFSSSASTNLENSSSAVAWGSSSIARNVFPATWVGMEVEAPAKDGPLPFACLTFAQRLANTMPVGGPPDLPPPLATAAGGSRGASRRQQLVDGDEWRRTAASLTPAPAMERWST